MIKKNNLFIGGSTLLFLLVSSSSAYASSISGGYVELSSSNLKSLVSVIKEGGLSLFKAKVKGKGLTPYQWHYIDGGKWLFGVYGTKVQSTYVHYGRTHSATAKNGMGAGTCVKVHAGITAFSQVNATMRNNKAYYNVY